MLIPGKTMGVRPTIEPLRLVCVVFTLNRSAYPTTSVQPVPVLSLHPRDTSYVVTD